MKIFNRKAFSERDYKIYYIAFLLVTFFSTIPAFAQQPDTSNLRIGIAGSSPFIMGSNNSQSGIAVEIWDAVADAENWNYTTQNFTTVSDALTALKIGKLDVVVGPVSITSERVKSFDFSQPYYFSGLSILSRKDDPTLLDRVRPFFSMKLAIAVLVFLLILAIVGTLIWLAERKKSPEQFPEDMPHGIANGMWLAIVTMSTTGYGDRAPITFWGRVIAGTWMVISIIFATTMVAGIASTLTLTGMSSNTITEASQLSGKKVAAPSFQVAKPFLDEFHAKSIQTNSLEEAYQLMEDKKVSAIVFDRPQLLYFKKRHPSANIIVGPSVYEPTGYGFAFTLKSPLIKKVNIRMLNLTETGRVKHIVEAWISDQK